jgi:nucleoside-diphosphate-sugar epimerase
MKVLVTGATSLLAGTTVRHLQARGHRVTVLQRRPCGLDVEEHLADIRDRAAVRRAGEGCEVIVHAAARVGITGTPAEFVSVNVGGTANVLHLARATGAGVVYVSSPSVAHRRCPLVAATASPAVVDHPALYPATKARAELLVLSSTDIATTAIRPHLVWGPGDDQLVGRIVQRARAGRLVLIGRGSALVDTTYVSNAADALVAATEGLHRGAAFAHRPVVVSNGEPRPIREIVERVCRATGVPFQPRSVSLPVARMAGAAAERLWRRGEPPITRFVADQLGTAHWFDPTEARRLLGWEPRIRLEEGFDLLQAASRPSS